MARIRTMAAIQITTHAGMRSDKFRQNKYTKRNPPIMKTEKNCGRPEEPFHFVLQSSGRKSSTTYYKLVGRRHRASHLHDRGTENIRQYLRSSRERVAFSYYGMCVSDTIISKQWIYIIDVKMHWDQSNRESLQKMDRQVKLAWNELALPPSVQWAAVRMFHWSRMTQPHVWLPLLNREHW